MSLPASKCSKNYVNCRKHPARVGDFRSLYEEDRVTAHKEFVKEWEQLNTELSNETKETLGAKVWNEKQRELKSLEMCRVALLPAAGYQKFLDTPTHFSDGTLMNNKPHVRYLRDKFKEELKKRIEREQFYGNHPKPLTNFQEAVAGLLVRKGDFYTDNNSWGDTRGDRLYGAREHFEKCKVVAVNDYSENSDWAVYDSFKSDKQVGISARVSCACGEQFKTLVFYETNGKSIIVELMND